MIAFVRTAALGLLGAALGGLSARLLYEAFGIYDFGDDFAGFQEVFFGVLLGVWTGAVVGGLAPWRRGLMASFGSIAIALIAGAIFATGVIYIGAWTDADGPSGVVPYVAILGLPAGPLIVFLLARALRERRPTSEPTSNR